MGDFPTEDEGMIWVSGMRGNGANRLMDLFNGAFTFALSYLLY